jgi:hypothetical protein
MRISIPLNPRFHSLCLLTPLAFAAALCGLQMLTAQAPQTAIPSSPAHRVLPTHTRPGAAHRLLSPVPAAPAPAIPPAPEVPDWPANDRPAPASVVWDSQGLRIDAKNSSLQQILKDFSTASGAHVEGMGNDQRVFGTYGPGLARDVLSQLLQGSGYNVIMIGDQGEGAPRQIVLSARQAGGAQPAATNNPASNNDDDVEADEPPQPQQPQQAVPNPPFRPGFPPGGPLRNQQQMNMQEQQMRQQQLQQQQMQQQQGQPQQTQQPSNPPN